MFLDIPSPKTLSSANFRDLESKFSGSFSEKQLLNRGFSRSSRKCRNIGRNMLLRRPQVHNRCSS